MDRGSPPLEGLKTLHSMDGEGRAAVRYWGRDAPRAPSLDGASGLIPGRPRGEPMPGRKRQSRVECEGMGILTHLPGMTWVTACAMGRPTLRPYGTPLPPESRAEPTSRHPVAQANGSRVPRAASSGWQC